MSKEVQRTLDKILLDLLINLDHLRKRPNLRVHILRLRDQHTESIREVFKTFAEKVGSLKGSSLSSIRTSVEELPSVKLETSISELIHSRFHHDPVRLAFVILNAFGFGESVSLKDQIKLIRQYGLHEIISPLSLRKKVETFFRREKNNMSITKDWMEIVDLLLIPLEYIPDHWDELAEILKIIQGRDNRGIEIVQPPEGIPLELGKYWVGAILPLALKTCPLVFSHSRMKNQPRFKELGKRWWMVDTAFALGHIRNRDSKFMTLFEEFYGTDHNQWPKAISFNYHSAKLVDLPLDENDNTWGREVPMYWERKKTV